MIDLNKNLRFTPIVRTLGTVLVCISQVHAAITIDPNSSGAIDVVAGDLRSGATMILSNPVADPLALADDIAVGNSAQGELLIDAMSEVVNKHGYIGFDAGSFGTVTVRGAGTLWNNDPGLIIGNEGTGVLRVEGGGAVQNQYAYLGLEPGSHGTVTVTGSGSLWNAQFLIYLGFYGDGILEVEAGAKVNSVAETVIGGAPGSDSRATVSGHDSRWDHAGVLVVGGVGDGTLRVESGGLLVSEVGRLGVENGGTGIATVTGAGSHWKNSAGLTVGELYIGSLNITDGGLVTVGGMLNIDPYVPSRSWSFVNISTGGMLALAGDADDSLADFLGLVGGSDAIRYWDAVTAAWAPITSATLGADYTLESFASGEFSGYTVLTVGQIQQVAGDYNADRVVDGGDYLVWQQEFGSQVTAFAGADGNGDGFVDAADYVVWRDHFGTQGGASQFPVPEPTSTLVLGIAAGIWTVGRRGQQMMRARIRPSTESRNLNVLSEVYGLTPYRRCVVEIAARSLAAMIVAFASNEALAANRVVTLSGQSVPGVGADMEFTGFWPPILNNSGDVTVRACFGDAETGDFGGCGLWLSRGETLDVVVRSGDPAHGTHPPRIFNGPSDVNLNDNGHVLFESLLENDLGESLQESGLWTWSNSGSRKIAATGDPAARDGSDAVFGWPLYSRILNNSGQTIFFNVLQPVDPSEPNVSSFWIGDAETLTAIAERGRQAAGLAEGVSFSYLYRDKFLVLNDAGQTSFFARVSGPEVTGENNGTIWFYDGKGIQLLAREGQTEGFKSGSLADLLGLREVYDLGPVINGSGVTAFISQGPTEETRLFNAEAIWMGRPGALQRVIDRDTLPPGTSPGTTFASVGLNLVLNGSSELAFLAELEGDDIGDDNDSGIWAGAADELRLVAQAGAPAPGTSGGTFQQFTRTDGPPLRGSAPSINSLGQVAFVASLVGPGIDDRNDRGIWAETLGHKLTLIAREGDELTVSPGDVRVVSHLETVSRLHLGTGNEDGRPSYFNDRGQLAFHAVFTDGSSGIFVSNAVAVPEPATALQSIVGISAVALFRRLRRPHP